MVGGRFFTLVSLIGYHLGIIRWGSVYWNLGCGREYEEENSSLKLSWHLFSFEQ